MNDKLSELVDGELGDDEADELIKVVGKSDELRAQWKTYHVIGEALRQPASISSLDVSAKIHQQLKDEPAILVPRFSKIYHRSKSKILGLPAAASIAVVTFAIGWIASISIENSPVKQEMLVVDKMDKRSTDTDNRTAAFLPPLGYSHLPATVDYSRADYPFVYRGFSHGSMIYHPRNSSTNPISSPQMPQTSVESVPSGN